MIINLENINVAKSWRGSLVVGCYLPGCDSTIKEEEVKEVHVVFRVAERMNDTGQNLGT